MVKINDITLKNVKRFSGMEDDGGFNADIYYKSEKIGFAMYGADGGETVVEFESAEKAAIFRKARFAYFTKNPPKNLYGRTCKKILSEDLDNANFKESGVDFKDLCCSSNEQFILELLLLMEREKNFKKLVKQYPDTTAMGVYTADVYIPANSGYRETGREWAVPMSGKSLEKEKKMWELQILSSLPQEKDKYRVNLTGIYNKDSFVVSV